MECGIILPDQHYPLVDRWAESCVLQAIEHVKPTFFVNIGDAGEWESVCHFRYERRKRPPLDYQLRELARDARSVNRGMDKFDQALDNVGCEERHFIEGNHEVWTDRLCEEFQVLKYKYTPKKLLRLEERGYSYYPYGQYVKFGKLNIYHGGHWMGKYHTHAHIRETASNVLYGHTHDAQIARHSTLSGPLGAWSIGCICDFKKPFLKGRPTNWSHAFVILHIERNGLFDVDLVDIVSKRCIVWGKRITG